MANDYISRQNVQLEIMSDGTLHITATVDVANTNRILLSQAGTHLGDLYYRDDERKMGRWIKKTIKKKIENDYSCSECGRHVSVMRGYDVRLVYPFCHCGAEMLTEDKE